MIEFKDIGFSYDEKTLLQHVDFTLNDGEFIGILGPNGGGKSTFLKLVLGIVKPLSGTRSVTDSNIGYLAQNNGIGDRGFQCTVEEFVGLGLIRGKKWFLNREDRALVKKTLQEYGIHDLRKHLLNRLSGGQLQRARLAKTLISDPSLVIFDEPDAGMDEESHHRMIHIIEALHNQGKSILFVSHHPHDLEHADRVYYIDNGEISLYTHGKEGHHVSL